MNPRQRKLINFLHAIKNYYIYFYNLYFIKIIKIIKIIKNEFINYPEAFVMGNQAQFGEGNPVGIAIKEIVGYVLGETINELEQV